MDSKVMELRLKKWIPIFEEQAKSGLNKEEWCRLNGVKRDAFYKWQRELRKYLLEKNENKFLTQLSTGMDVHTIPGFVELSPATSSVQSSMNNGYVRSENITPVSSIIIKYGKFSINLNNDVDELLLSKVLRVISDAH